MKRFALLLCLGLTAFLAAPMAEAATGPRQSSSGSSWLTYGGNFSRTSYQPRASDLRSLRVRWTNTAIDGQIYGQPLIFDGRVFVATENNVVYALSAGTGKVIWTRFLGNPVPANVLPCGDITPNVGVTSTMVIDPVIGRLFVSAAVYKGRAVTHMLFGLSAASGYIAFAHDLDVPGWSAEAQLQRAGLGLDRGAVLVAFGGNWGDCGRYHGYVISVPENNGAQRSFQVPTENEGAIWGPAGMAINAAGDIFVSTGNGSSSSRFDEGDSVIELSPSLRQIGLFAPSDWRADNAKDLDLGSNAPILIPGNRVFVVGKETTGYLLTTTALRGVNSAHTSVSVCFSIGAMAYAADTVFAPCPDTSMTAVSLKGATPTVIWKAPPQANGSPTVAAGLVWSVSSGRLYGLAPQSGKVVVSVPTLATEHFAAPSAAEGLLVVGGAHGVQAFEGRRGWTP